MGRPRSPNERRGDYLRATGRAGYVPAGPVRDRIRYLHDQMGVPIKRISERTGLHVDALKCQYHGVNKCGKPIKFAEMATERAVLGTQFGPDDCRYFPAIGIRRRLQALAAAGFTLPFVAPLVGEDYRNLHRTMSGGKGREFVAAHRAATIIEVYDKLSRTTPEAAGVGKQSASRARGFARSNGYAPAECWDSDTIDDPDAIPEWTGRCGTVYGWRIHEIQGIPICAPCSDLQGAEQGTLSGDRLRDLRVRRGYSQDQLAKAAGLKVDQYRSWECNRTKPRFPHQLDQILTVLDVTYDEVCE